MIRRFVRWIDDRLGASSFTRSALNKVFPDHWSFMLGEIAMYAFLILVLTGIFLSFFFDPSSRETVYNGAFAPLHGVTMSEAYRSVVELSFDVRAGLVMRQIHHWAAIVFIAAITVHLCRVFFTGAFRRPREINWVIGITLLVLAMFNGFTGYSLPDDLLSGTGLRIAYSIALSIPVVGTWIAFLVFGGEFPADQIIGRLEIIHIMLIPGIIFALLGAHLAIVWRQKHTQFPGPGRTETNVVGSKLYPTYMAKSLGLFAAVFAVLALLGGFAQINPVWLYGPFEPASVASPAQPDWWLGWVEGALRVFPPWEVRLWGFEIPNPFFPAVLLPGVTFLLLYLWPWIERRRTKDEAAHELLDRPRDRPVRTALGAVTLAFYGVLFFAASNDLIAKTFAVSVTKITWAFRIALIVVPTVIGWFTYRLCKATTRTEAEDVFHVPLKAVLEKPR
ncbi:MAG TPA: ubiquinol-cytochrome c reductase cytochrome b subunit [Actinomycetota bacterium]|nr:ubiquinol-cytochrome c reductase cytochrome b subunit [Actinomycetota bacterium]